jgi:S1-C subfamily serine protease
VKLTVLRSEGRTEIPVRLAMMPASMVGERTAAELGFVLREPEGTALPRPLGPIDSAAVVAVIKGTPAERAGLAVGDVVVQVNGRPVRDGEAVRDALADSEPGRPVTLTVRREAEERTFTVTP